MKKSLFQKFFILLFALPALACGLFGGDEPTATPAPAATAEVSATLAPTAAPSPTSEPEVEPTPDLAADFVSYTSTDTGITVKHPADWAVQDFFVLLIATDETIFDAPDSLREGAGVVFAAGPADEFESTDPIALANEAVEEFDLSEDATIVEGPTAVIIQGQQAAIARVEATPTETGIPRVGLAVVIISGDRVGVGLGITPQASEAEYLPTIEAMLYSMVVGEAPDETEVSGNLPTVAGSLPVSVGDTLAGTLNENGERDYIFSGRADETVTFIIETEDDGIDLVLEIFDGELNSLDREDNEFSGEAERLVFTPPADGDYFVRVSDFYDSSGSFSISVVAGAVLDTESVDENAARLETGILVEAALTGDTVQYVFAGTAGEVSTVLLQPDEDLDATLTILDTNGNTLTDRADDGFSGEPEAISFVPEANGDYIVLIDGFGSLEGSYSLFLVDGGNAFTAEGSAGDNQSQTYRVCVPANASLVVVVLPEEDFDVVVNVNGPGGGQLIDQTDNGFSGELETVFMTEAVDPIAAYPVIVAVSGFAGQSGDFSVIITSTSSEAVVLDGC